MASDPPSNLNEAESEPADGAAGATSPSGGGGLQAINDRLDNLGRQLELTRAETQPPAAAPPQLTDTLTRLDHRLDRLMHEGRTASDTLERRIAAVDRALATLNQDVRGQPEPQLASPPFAPADDDGDRAFGLDSAVAEIAARQRMLDAANPLQQQFTALSRRLGGAPPGGEADPTDFDGQLRALTEELREMRRPGGFRHTVDVLRRELADIGRQLTEAAPQGALEALETEVRTLADRIGYGREHGGDAAAFAGIERSLDQVRQMLADLAPAESLAIFREEVRALDHRIDAATVNATDPAANPDMLRQFDSTLAELREAAARAASGEALDALAEEVQAMGDKVDRLIDAIPAAGPDLSSILEQRFQELAAHLHAREQSAAAIPDQLSAMVEQLAGKLEQVELGRDNTPLLDAISRQITRLTAHAEATEARLETVDQFEHSMRELLDGMDQLRAGTIAAAERAARQAALDVARQLAAGEGEGLRHELDALRQSQGQNDRRTQDTLEAVHDTLERLVDRMASVETDLHDGRDAPRIEAPPIGGRSPEASQLAPLPSAFTPERRVAPRDDAARLPPVQTLETPAQTVAVRERRAIDPTLPADHPLEPGALRSRAGASAAERIAASEAALGAAKPATEADAKSNFIAAARRAAQAAANMTSPGDASEQTEKPAASAFSALAQKFTGRRALMLGLILLVSAGAVHLLIKGIGSAESPRTEATRPAVSRAAPPAAVPSLPTGGIGAQSSAGTPSSPAPTAVASPPPISPPLPRLPDSGAAAAEERPEQSSPSARTTPSVSPLTIASIALSTGDPTGTVGRATGPGRKPEATGNGAPAAAPGELPAAFSKGLRAAALAGDAAAEYEIASRYVEGRGVPLKFEEAARWFERAANRGLAPAQYRLGSLYEKGHGVRKDLDQARRLYRAASDAGNAKAMHNLAVLYAEGIEGRPDFRNAADWFRKAAACGVADSQYNLGILYARGLGVDQNLAESYKWFALAARQGDQDAGKKRDDVAARLDQAALAAARLAVQTFAIAPQPPEATTVTAPAGGWDAGVPAAPTRPKLGPGAPRRSKPS